MVCLLADASAFHALATASAAVIGVASPFGSVRSGAAHQHGHDGLDEIVEATPELELSSERE
jgi:hypothetical protein